MTELTSIIDRQRPPILNARLSQAVERNELSYERALCIEIEATRAEVQALRDEIAERHIENARLRRRNVQLDTRLATAEQVLSVGMFALLLATVASVVWLVTIWR